MTRVLLVAVLAACRGGDAPAPATPTTTIPVTPTEKPDHEVEPVIKTEAKNDLPHLRAKLGPLLAPMSNCVPPADLLGDPDGDPLELVLDAIAGKLVACAVMPTARGGSVYHDPVAYACWDVDPASGRVSRRADLGRTYLNCSDGSCPPGSVTSVASYDGSSQLALDPAAHTFSIGSRTFPAPTELVEPLRGDLVYVGHIIFAVVDATIHVLDDRGAPRASLPGISVRVVDDTHVLIADADDHVVEYDLAASTSHAIKAPKYAASAVRFGTELYAVDDQRRLAALDPATFGVRRTVALPVCR